MYFKSQLVGIQADSFNLVFLVWRKIVFRFQIFANNKLDKERLLSFATYYMHLIFARIPSLVNSDLILYILPALTVAILFFSLKIMFFKTPKLRKVK